ncbi:MAG TPA: alpha/beta fold hydrolase [Ilumatobacteraceae bacterium]|nr:alpha/beta fold hydrolase [Ilumatobacteraceae bacterium]
MAELQTPWLPAGHVLLLPGRGEIFYRHHRHPDPSAPTLLLLHGWTATADLQFFTAYEALAEHWSFVAVDHRGHGRGLRSPDRFELEDAADDAAALVRALGVGPVITVGYSMGGPISLLLAHRHPDLVAGMVVQATALEWRAKWYERWQWKTLHLLGFVLRSRALPRLMRWGIRRLMEPTDPLAVYVPWVSAELRRNDTFNIVQAGQSLSRYDARDWAHDIGKPAASLITTRDRLVWPRKQRALAAALDAHVVELRDDHLASWTSAQEFSAKTVELVRNVAERVRTNATV